MSATIMASTTDIPDYEEVYMDPKLELELFGDPNTPCKQILGVIDTMIRQRETQEMLDTLTDAQYKAMTGCIRGEGNAARKARLAREAEEAREADEGPLIPSVKRKYPFHVRVQDPATTTKQAQRSVGPNAKVGATRAKSLIETAAQLEREQLKQKSNERRQRALKAQALGTVVGTQKRKRGGEKEGEGVVVKKGLTDAVAKEIAEGRECGFEGDLKEEEGEKKEGAVGIKAEEEAVDHVEKVQEAKHAASTVLDSGDEMNDSVIGSDVDKGAEKTAASAQEGEHAASTASESATKSGDSTTGSNAEVTTTQPAERKQKMPVATARYRKRKAEEEAEAKAAKRECAGDGVVGKTPAEAESKEQHLAPPDTSSPTSATNPDDLTISEDDDEMTRMLKAELDKPCVATLLADPRVTQFFAPLTEADKAYITDMLYEREATGKPPATIASVEKAAKMMLANRRKKEIQKKPAKASPLAGELILENPDVEGDGEKAVERVERKLLVPKSREVAPKPGASDTQASTPHSPASHTDGDTGDTAATPPQEVSKPLLTSPETLTLADLKAHLKSRSLAVSGNKAVLVQRLKEYEGQVRAGKKPSGVKKKAGRVGGKGTGGGK